jgi:hypothetical protein
MIAAKLTLSSFLQVDWRIGMRKNLRLLLPGKIALFFLFAGTLLIGRATPYSAALPRKAVEVVPNGTHFLVGLDRELGTIGSRVNDTFSAKTLEPLETSRGHILRPGATIRGHISRIDPAGLTGHARLWLTFDDIDTNKGRLPIVAEVSSVPGDFGVRQGDTREGEIEARGNDGAHEAEDVATGAAKGAAAGVFARSAKQAALGAASGAISAFVASSANGRDVDLPEGTKLDLVLDRPLYLTR